MGAEPETVLGRPKLLAPPPVADTVAGEPAFVHRGRTPQEGGSTLRAVERAEHRGNVLRLEKALRYGIVVWLSSIGIDWMAVRMGELPAFGPVLALRLAVAAVVAVCLVRLRRPPTPSPRFTAVLDVGVYTLAAAGIVVIGLYGQGVHSVFGFVPIVVLVARGCTMFDHWRVGWWRYAVPASAYPVLVLGSAAFLPSVRAQLATPEGWFVFSVVLVNTLFCCAFLTLGGHVVWQYRRLLFEERAVSRYRLERRIAEGGMGEVWAAYDTALDKRVALKLLPGASLNPVAVARFEREVRATTQLEHPNTVRVTDYGVTDDGTWFYAMELLEGETLADRIGRGGPMAPGPVVGIADAIARALSEAHDKGVLHRDIKPTNVFLAVMGGERDVVKLLDFGIARLLEEDAELTKGLIGTPGFLAPEILAGLPASMQTDIYSFGATLYSMLAGVPPFGGASPWAIIATQQLDDLVPPGARRTDDVEVPEALERVVMRCLARDPAERFATFADVLAALRELAEPA